MPVIDSRLINPDTDVDTTENFNRVLAIIDTLSGVVADIEDSQLFKVTFDSDGGSSVATQYVIEGEKAIEPDDPTKEDYTFIGWHLGTSEYDFDTEVTSHLSLKAVWEANEAPASEGE